VVARRGGEQYIPRPPSYEVGPLPAWAGLAPDRRRFTLDEVRARLVDLPPAREPVARAEGSREAAVLMPLFERDGEVNVVLIKRPDTMPSHQGEIAFPGGKYEPGIDRDLEATALREAYEEVGLATNDVEVVSKLDGIGTVASRFTIQPYVGFLPGDFVLVPSPREVVRVLEVPLSELLDPDVYHMEYWGMWVPDLAVHFYDLDDETVWGATARILTGFLAHLVAGR
jgi:8-oxo-dGTP pyrophosphatase MutT (NUDIX family)